MTIVFTKRHENRLRIDWEINENLDIILDNPPPLEWL